MNKKLTKIVFYILLTTNNLYGIQLNNAFFTLKRVTQFLGFMQPDARLRAHRAVQAEVAKRVMNAVLLEDTTALKVLLPKLSNKNFCDSNGQTALMASAYNGNTKHVSLLLKYGAAIDQADKDGQTALMCAIFSNKIPTVRLLLHRGVNVNARDTQDRTPLIWATYNGYTEIVKSLLRKKAAIDATDSRKQTALSWAITQQHRTTASLLLKNGADTNKKNENGYTALMIATALKESNLVRLLIKQKTKIDIETLVVILESSRHYDDTVLTRCLKPLPTIPINDLRRGLIKSIAGFYKYPFNVVAGQLLVLPNQEKRITRIIDNINGGSDTKPAREIPLAIKNR